MAAMYPEFVDNATFIQMDSSVSEAEQLRAMLNNLTRVHHLTARKFDSLDDLISEYLSSGCEIFGLETGIVSFVDDDNIYHVLDVISPIEVLERGQKFELNDTYCREVVKTQSVIGFPEVGALNYMNSHPVYTNLKLEAYLSAPIYVDDKLFGTLNFTSTHRRNNGFSKNEYNLILLMANSIGNYLLLRNKNEGLEELNRKIMQFVGFVAHDLRNPIGGILGLSQLAEMELDNKTELAEMLPKITATAEDALELIKSVLDMAALSTGTLKADIEVVSIDEIASKALDAISDLVDEHEVSIDHRSVGTTLVFCDAKRIKQVLINLLVNAIKYSPKGSKVKFQVIQEEPGTTIKIVNSVSNTQVQNENVSSIYDSVGFGLEIVKTILKAHDSELLLAELDDQVQASFTLKNAD